MGKTDPTDAQIAASNAFIDYIKDNAPEVLSTDQILFTCCGLICSYAGDPETAARWFHELGHILADYYNDPIETTKMH